MTVLKIFSYLPNPRVMKATIAARALGVEVEVVGDSTKNLVQWLWDFDPRPLSEEERTPESPYLRQGKRGFGTTLYKTDEFLSCHPFGTVPAAFSPDGTTGIFESNSILRAVARAGNGLYGNNGYEASRIDSFLDTNLVFSREFQPYVLALPAKKLDVTLYERMFEAYDFYVAGIDAAIGSREFLVADELSIADISFACDFAQFDRERYYTREFERHGLVSIRERMANSFPNAERYHQQLLRHPAIAPDLGPYVEQFMAKLAQRESRSAP